MAARKIAREVASEEDKESARETAYTDRKKRLNIVFKESEKRCKRRRKIL